MYDRFVQLLQERGITAYRVSKETGVTQTTLSDWKTGRATPKIATLQKIAEYFEVSVDWLIGNTNYRKGEEYSANKDIVLVARHLEEIPDEDREAVIKTIEQVIDLCKKGLKKCEKKEKQ